MTPRRSIFPSLRSIQSSSAFSNRAPPLRARDWRPSTRLRKARRASRRYGCADHTQPHGSRSARDPQACADAGAQFAGYTVVRLPFAVAPLFERWLAEHFPDRKEKVLGRDQASARRRATERSAFQQPHARGRRFCRADPRALRGWLQTRGLGERPRLSTAGFRRPNEQLRLFNQSKGSVPRSERRIVSVSCFPRSRMG